jgi:hypothetical protein
LRLSHASAALPEPAGETIAVATSPPGPDTRTAPPAERDEAASGAPSLDWRFLAGAAGVLLGMRGGRRRELCLLAAAMLCAAAILYLPGPYALAVRAMRSAWIANRLQFIVFLGFVIGVAGTLVTITAAAGPSRWTRLVVIVVSAALGILFQPPEQRRGWFDHLRQASEPGSVRMASRNRLKHE